MTKINLSIFPPNTNVYAISRGDNPIHPNGDHMAIYEAVVDEVIVKWDAMINENVIHYKLKTPKGKLWPFEPKAGDVCDKIEPLIIVAKEEWAINANSMTMNFDKKIKVQTLYERLRRTE